MPLHLSQEKELEIKLCLSKKLKNPYQIDIFLILMKQSLYAFEKVFQSPVFVLKKGVSRDEFIQYQKELSKTLFQTPQKQSDNNLEENLLNLKPEPFEQDQQKSQINLVNQDQESYQVSDIKWLSFQLENQNKKKQIQMNIYESFKQTFRQILNIYQIQLNEELIESVLKHGAKNLDHLRFQKDFEDKKIRQDIHKMLIITQSFNKLAKFGAHDIRQLQKQLSHQINKCLHSLKIPSKFIQVIKDRLIEDPLSLDILQMRILNDSKIKFLQSKFYISGVIERYSQALSYPESIYAKAIEDISQLLKEVSSICLVTKQIYTIIYNFDLYGLLQHPNIQSKKTIIYETIRDKYKAFYKACQNVKYFGHKEKDLQIQGTIKIRFQLRRKFLQCKLSLQKWKQAQQALLNRQQNIIHNLQLTLDQKEILRQFYRQNIQPYFHKLQRPKAFKEVIEQILFQQCITNCKLRKKQTQLILNFIKEMMRVQQLQESQIIDELTPKQKIQLISILKNNKQFQLYKDNKGVDRQQQKYQKINKIKALIYKINYQDQIQVSYQSIQKFINSFIESNLQIAGKLKFYVCDLQKLNQHLVSQHKFYNKNKEQIISDQKDQIFLQEKMDELPNIQDKVKQNQVKKLQLIEEFNKFIQKQTITKKQSRILKFRKTIFQDDRLQFGKILLQNRLFQGRFDYLRQFITQSGNTMNKKYISGLLSELNQLNKQIIEKFMVQFYILQLQKPKFKNNIKKSDVQEEIQFYKKHKFDKQQQLQSLKKEKALIINDFIKQYKILDEPKNPSKLAQLILNKFEEPEKIIQMILDSNPFYNLQAPFFDQLVQKEYISEKQKNKLLQQFKDNKHYNQLGLQFANLYKNIKQKLHCFMKDV